MGRVSEGVNSGLTSHQQRGHTETGPRFKVSSERPKKRGIDLAIPGLVVQRVIHYTTAAPIVWEEVKNMSQLKSKSIWSLQGWKNENIIKWLQCLYRIHRVY